MAILSYWQDTIQRFRYVALIGGGISLWMISSEGFSTWTAGVTALQPMSIVQGLFLIAGGTAALDMVSMSQ